MQSENTLLHHAEEIAADVWRKMGLSNPAAPEKQGTVPQVQIKRLDGGLNGLAWPGRIELNIDGWKSRPDLLDF